MTRWHGSRRSSLLEVRNKGSLEENRRSSTQFIVKYWRSRIYVKEIKRRKKLDRKMRNPGGPWTHTNLKTWVHCIIEQNIMSLNTSISFFFFFLFKESLWNTDRHVRQRSCRTDLLEDLVAYLGEIDPILVLVRQVRNLFRKDCTNSGINGGHGPLALKLQKWHQNDKEAWNN